MHPNTFLRTFWRAELRPEVFVAMSFDPIYTDRYTSIIERAITAITYRGQKLSASRVDLSQSGDSILTDIIDGIAHSVMVLADVSTVGNDSKSGRPYRNGNVMYEVGLALASRHASEVLLIREDKAPFLFDVSTVPHMHIDFADATAARTALSQELVARLKEIDHIHDARLAVAVASLTSQERQVLAGAAHYEMNQVFWFKAEGLGVLAAVPRLLDKGLIRTVRATSEGKAAFGWTELGKTLATNLDRLVPILPLPPNTSETTEGQESAKTDDTAGKP